MNMNDTSTDNGGMMVMMTPFFHFVSGDYLLFQAWKPASGGAIAGACIGLFFFALFDRWLPIQLFFASLMLRSCRTLQNTPIELLGKTGSCRSGSDATEDSASAKKSNSLPKRTFPPFMATVDIPRGILYAFQRLLGFGLMLSVMTFNAGYIISILVGLGLGEILFGRISAVVPKHDH